MAEPEFSLPNKNKSYIEEIAPFSDQLTTVFLTDLSSLRDSVRLSAEKNSATLLWLFLSASSPSNTSEHFGIRRR